MMLQQTNSGPLRTTTPHRPNIPVGWKRSWLGWLAALGVALGVSAPSLVEAGAPKPSIKVQGNKIVLAVKPRFPPRKTHLDKSCHAQLDQLAKYLNKHDKLFLRIEGHTDSRGSSRFNKLISQRRADAIKKYLIAQGVNDKRIQAIGYGEAKPIASNRTRRGRMQNRRFEFWIAKGKPHKK